MCAKMMWFVRQATTIELSMVAAERLRELAWLQPEAWAGLPSAAPAPSWPQSGACAAPSGRRGLGWGEEGRQGRDGACSVTAPSPPPPASAPAGSQSVY